MKDKELLKLFLKNRWELRRIKESHYHLLKDGKRETLAVHGREIHPNLAKKLLDGVG